MKTLLYIINVDWFFLSHFLPHALASKRKYRVIVAAGSTGKDDEIRSHGLEFSPLPLDRKGVGIFSELKTFAAVWKLVRETRPDLLHLFTIKPILYGSLTAYFLPRMPAVNYITGFGYVFSNSARASFLRRLILPFYRFALRRRKSWCIFENSGDLEYAVRRGFSCRERTVLIRGAGVDTERFCPQDTWPEPPVVLLACRMLWDKGVQTFIDAVPLVRESFPGVRFVLVGAPDEENPTSVPASKLEEWSKLGLAEYSGPSTDMPATLNGASLVVLPSFHEGMPKVLAEAAACGKPIIASDIPGCREVVRHGENGLLVPVRDSVRLAKTICTLLADPAKMKEMGAKGREMAEELFDVNVIVARLLDLYDRIEGGERFKSFPK